jgi:hypothetical protein
MKLFTHLGIASTLAAGILAAAPSSAAVTTFAQYNQVAGANAKTLMWRQIGTGGRLCTISTSNGSCPVNPAVAVTQSIDVNFSFLQSGIGNSGSIAAKLLIDLIVAPGTPAQTASFFGTTYIVQPGLSGSFSIIADTPFTYNSITGSNLLSGTIGNATISGAVGSTSGGVNGSDSIVGQTVAFTSDFLDFGLANTGSQDFALTLTSIANPLAKTGVGPMRSFRAAATGSFSSDPAPLVNGAVPEPVIWGMMVVGFGMVGNTMRTRRRVTA